MSVEQLTKELEVEKKQLKEETKYLKKIQKKTKKLSEENQTLKSEYDTITSPSVSRISLTRNTATVESPEEARLMRAMSPRQGGGMSKVKSSGAVANSRIIKPTSLPAGDWTYVFEIRASSGTGTKFLKVKGSTIKGENTVTKDISLIDSVYLDCSWGDLKGKLGGDFPHVGGTTLMEHPSSDRRSIDDTTKISTLGFELVDFRNNLFKFYTTAVGDIPKVSQANANNSNLPKWKRDQLEAERLKQERIQKEEEAKMKKVASIKHIQKSKGMDVEAQADDGIPRTFSSSTGHTFTENLVNQYVTPIHESNGHPESGVVTESALKMTVDEEAMAKAEEERLMKTVIRRGF